MEAEKATVFPNKLCRIVKPGLTREQLDKLNTKKLKEAEMRKWRLCGWASIYRSLGRKRERLRLR